MVNPAPGAAVGMRALTCAMTQMVTIGAFARALPDLIPDSAPGGHAITNVKATDRAGRRLACCRISGPACVLSCDTAQDAVRGPCGGRMIGRAGRTNDICGQRPARLAPVHEGACDDPVL